MLRRIALLISIVPRAHGLTSELRVSDINSQRALLLEQSSFVLTLENEPLETFTRGQLKLLHDGTTFPIQSNLALLDFLTSLLNRTAGTE